MKYCQQCGNSCEDYEMQCSRCGARFVDPLASRRIESQPKQERVSPQRNYGNAQQSAPINPPRQVQAQPVSNGLQQQIPPEYKPITMWGYFGYQIVFAIPIIGLVLLLVFSLGGTNNINLRNYARSFFCFAIVCFVVFMLFFGGCSALLSRY